MKGLLLLFTVTKFCEEIMLLQTTICVSFGSQLKRIY